MKVNKSIVLLALVSGVTIEAMQTFRNLGQRLMQQAPEIQNAARQTLQTARKQVQPAVEAAQGEIAEMRAPGAADEAMSQLGSQFNTPRANALKDAFSGFRDRMFGRIESAPDAMRGAARDLATNTGQAVRDYGQGAKQFYTQDIPAAAKNVAESVSSKAQMFGNEFKSAAKNAKIRSGEAAADMLIKGKTLRTSVMPQAQSLSETVSSKLSKLKNKLRALNPFSWRAKTPTESLEDLTDIDMFSGASRSGVEDTIFPFERRFELVETPYTANSDFRLVGSPTTPRSTAPSALVPYAQGESALVPLESGVLPTLAGNTAAIIRQFTAAEAQAFLEGEKAAMERLGILISQAAKQMPVPTIAPDVVEGYLDTSDLMPHAPVAQGDLYSLDGFAPTITESPSYGRLTEGQNQLLGNLKENSYNNVSKILRPSDTSYNPGPIVRAPFLPQEPQTTHIISPRETTQATSLILPERKSVKGPMERRIAEPQTRSEKRGAEIDYVRRQANQDHLDTLGNGWFGDLSKGISASRATAPSEPFTPTGVSHEFEHIGEESTGENLQAPAQTLIDNAPNVTLDTATASTKKSTEKSKSSTNKPVTLNSTELSKLLSQRATYNIALNRGNLEDSLTEAKAYKELLESLPNGIKIKEINNIDDELNKVRRFIGATEFTLGQAKLKGSKK